MDVHFWGRYRFLLWNNVRFVGAPGEGGITYFRVLYFWFIPYDNLRNNFDIGKIENVRYETMDLVWSHHCHCDRTHFDAE
jgi:hypothetical protein